MALMRIVNDISNDLGNNIYSLGILTSFESIRFGQSQNMVAKKCIINYGIRGIVLDWFNDSLANRTQYVSINNTNSKILTIQ